ncbi:hypothetical protein T439DRAFT_331699 [Meredithblackwellia eburnea MCA 4105]
MYQHRGSQDSLRSNRRPSAALPPIPPSSPPRQSSSSASSRAYINRYEDDYAPSHQYSSLRHEALRESSNGGGSGRPSSSSSSRREEPRRTNSSEDYRTQSYPSRPSMPQRMASESVIERMSRGGWVGVASASSSTVDLGAPMHGSPSLDKRGSADSGYSEGTSSAAEKGSYFGNWSKLKKVVWGEEENVSTPTAAPQQGPQLWDKFIAVATGHPDDDDDTVGPDGETKLSRCIKEYHISRAQSSGDLPDWLFTPQERSARTTAAQRHRNEDSAPPHSHPQIAGVMNQSQNHMARRGSVEDFNPFARRGSGTTVPESQRGQSTRATDRLRAMRDAKKAARV